MVSRDLSDRKGPHHVNQVTPLDRFGQDREPLRAGGWINAFDKQNHPPGETGKWLAPGRTAPDRTFVDDDAGRGVCLGRSLDCRERRMRFNHKTFDFERELERTPEPRVGRHD